MSREEALKTGMLLEESKRILFEKITSYTSGARQ